MSIGDATNLKRKDIEKVGDWGVITLTRQKTRKWFMTIVPPDCMKSLERFWDKEEQDDRVLGYEKEGAQQALRRLAEEMKLWEKQNGERTNPLHPHGLRHGFMNALRNANCDSQLIEFVVGHDIGTAASYIEMTPEQLVELRFLKLCVGYLQIRQLRQSK